MFCVSHVQGNICSMPLLACCALIGGTYGCMVYGSLSGNACIIGKGACLCRPYMYVFTTNVLVVLEGNDSQECQCQCC